MEAAETHKVRLQVKLQAFRLCLGWGPVLRGLQSLGQPADELV